MSSGVTGDLFCIYRSYMHRLRYRYYMYSHRFIYRYCTNSRYEARRIQVVLQVMYYIYTDTMCAVSHIDITCIYKLLYIDISRTYIVWSVLNIKWFHR